MEQQDGNDRESPQSVNGGSVLELGHGCFARWDDSRSRGHDTHPPRTFDLPAEPGSRSDFIRPARALHRWVATGTADADLRWELPAWAAHRGVTLSRRGRITPRPMGDKHPGRAPAKVSHPNEM